MSVERMQVLKMIEAGKISAEEGAKLLEAVDATAAPPPKAANAQWFRIRVYNTKTGKSMVNVNLPIQLLDVALKFVPKESMGGMEKIDTQAIIQAIREGAQGKIVDITDEDDDERVEIFIE